MPLTPPTLVNPTAVGQMFELAHFVLNAQQIPEQNPDEEAVITNLNYDADTSTGSFQVNFEFQHGTDPTDGNGVMVIVDPFNDPV